MYKHDTNLKFQNSATSLLYTIYIHIFAKTTIIKYIILDIYNIHYTTVGTIQHIQRETKNQRFRNAIYTSNQRIIMSILCVPLPISIHCLYFYYTSLMV